MQYLLTPEEYNELVVAKSKAKEEAIKDLCAVMDARIKHSGREHCSAMDIINLVRGVIKDFESTAPLKP